MDGLTKFAEGHKIDAAHLSGLGAAERVEIAYYNLTSKEYERTTIAEDVEIVSLVGNIGREKDGDIIVHLHGVFARRDLSTFGGHIFSCVISGAGELHVTALSGELTRAYDQSTGLKLMCQGA